MRFSRSMHAALLIALVAPGVPPSRTEAQGVGAIRSKALAAAFNMSSHECRKQLQRALVQLQFFNGKIDGRWSGELAEAIGKWVDGVGMPSFYAATIPVSRGLIWTISASDANTLRMDCPMPPY